jgi:hypothetical protein
MIYNLIESRRHLTMSDECWNLSLWCDLWIIHLTTISKRDADFAERKMTKCSIRCIHYADADNETRANEFERSLHLSSERRTSDRWWRCVWWRKCILEQDSFLFRFDLNKTKMIVFQKMMNNVRICVNSRLLNRDNVEFFDCWIA